MSVASGPNVNTNGLVFYYDMGNPQTSWEGAPTTNLVDPNWSSWSIDGSGQGSIGTRTITGSFACTITDVAANTRQNIYISTGISASTTYTFSVQYQKLAGTPTLRFQIQAYNGATYLSTISFPTTAQLGITDIDGWQTAKITITTPASTNRILWFMQDGDDYTAYTHSFMLANAQCEQQSFATPFVWGTRSNTQAILDLTKKSTITATNPTYNSNGTFSFNGGTDSMFINDSIGPISNNFSIGAWINSTSIASTQNILSMNGPYFMRISNSRVRFNVLTDTGWLFQDGTTALQSNVWYYFTMVYNYSSSLWIGYINAQQEFSVSKSGIVNYSSFYGYVGYTPQGGEQSNFYGQIANVHYYNRALSATEVAQNFNAIRGRYGI
jgi:hypothetical protein